MAGVFFTLDSGMVNAPAANTNLTLVQVVPPTNQRVLVHHAVFSIDGTSATDDTFACELATQTSAGTASALSPGKFNETDGETIQTSAQQTFTGEPTTTTIKAAGHIQEEGDRFEWGYPRNPNPIPVKGGNRLGARIRPGTTITGTVKVRVILLCEE